MQNFRMHGYLSLGVGKYFHDVNRGLGVMGDERYPAGTGLPPLCDPVSWSNVSAQNRNYSAMQEEYGRFNQILQGCAYTGGVMDSSKWPKDYRGGFGYVDAMDGCAGKGVQHCAVEGVPPSGKVPASGSVTPFCDYIAYTDAIKKLEYAATAAEPFFLAVGIRRPHLTFRVPKPCALDSIIAANPTTPTPPQLPLRPSIPYLTPPHRSQAQRSPHPPTPNPTFCTTGLTAAATAAALTAMGLCRRRYVPGGEGRAASAASAGPLDRPHRLDRVRGAGRHQPL
jgi:hypothetical protein